MGAAQLYGNKTVSQEWVSFCSRNERSTPENQLNEREVSGKVLTVGAELDVADRLHPVILPVQKGVVD